MIVEKEIEENDSELNPVRKNTKKDLNSQPQYLLHKTYIKDSTIAKNYSEVVCQLCMYIVFDPIFCYDCRNLLCLSCTRDKNKIEVNVNTLLLK